MHTVHATGTAASDAPSPNPAPAGEAAPRVDVGRIGIEGAFESADTLESALAFARGQHMTISADCAVSSREIITDNFVG